MTSELKIFHSALRILRDREFVNHTVPSTCCEVLESLTVKTNVLESLRYLYYTIWHILFYLKEIYRNLWGNMLIIMKWFLHFGQSYLKAQAGVQKPFELYIQNWSEDPLERKIKECCSCDISVSEYFFGKRTYWGTDWCWLPFNWLEASFQSHWYFIITVATNWTFRWRSA